MNPHKKEESSFCSDSGWLCVWGPHSPSVDFSVWMAASRLSLKIPEKRGPIMLGGQQNTMGLLEQSVEDQLGEVWLQYD